MTFTKLLSVRDDGYADFLISAYQDQFNSRRFKDRDQVVKRYFWEYEQNPHLESGKPTIWVCRIEGRIIGQFCAMPATLYINGHPCKAGWCQDFIVLPQYRKAGIGRLLTKHLIDESKEYFDLLLVAGTNEVSYKIFKEAGFKSKGWIDRKIKMVFSFAAASRSQRDIDIVDITVIDREFDDLWQRMYKKFGCLTERSQKSLAWRFMEQPCLKYNIFAAKRNGLLEGYIAIRQSRINSGILKDIKIGCISDLFFDPSDDKVGDSLLRSAFDYFKGKVNIVRFDALGKYMEEASRKAGFFDTKSNNKFMIYLLRKEVEIKEDRWHMTYADSDLDISY